MLPTTPKKMSTPPRPPQENPHSKQSNLLKKRSFKKGKILNFKSNIKSGYFRIDLTTFSCFF